MKRLDRLLQRWRLEKVRPWVRDGLRVLDIGTLDGALFRAFPGVGPSVGLDPLLAAARRVGPAVLRPGLFPGALERGEVFDLIVMLAVLEHVPADALDSFAQAIAERLVPGGHLALTVPGPMVDRILDVLLALRLADGMSVEEHHGYEVAQTVPLFEKAGLECVEAARFQLGLNHLFVFKKPAST